MHICLALEIVVGFGPLLPEPELGPLALARGEKLPQRIRKRMKKGIRRQWKDGE